MEGILFKYKSTEDQSVVNCSTDSLIEEPDKKIQKKQKKYEKVALNVLDGMKRTQGIKDGSVKIYDTQNSRLFVVEGTDKQGENQIYTYEEKTGKMHKALKYNEIIGHLYRASGRNELSKKLNSRSDFITHSNVHVIRSRADDGKHTLHPNPNVENGLILSFKSGNKMKHINVQYDPKNFTYIAWDPDDMERILHNDANLDKIIALFIR